MVNQLAKTMHEIARQNRKTKLSYTNADRIRAMNDEELAEQLVVSLDGIAPRTMWAAPATGKMYLSGELAVKDMLAWLTQPAKEE